MTAASEVTGRRWLRTGRAVKARPTTNRRRPARVHRSDTERPDPETAGYAGDRVQELGICRPSPPILRDMPPIVAPRSQGSRSWPMEGTNERPGRSLHVQHRHHYAPPATVRRGPPGRGRLSGPLLGPDPQELRERPAPVLRLVRLGRSRGLRHQAGPHRAVGPLHGGKGVWPGPPSGGGCRRWPASTGSACSTA